MSDDRDLQKVIDSERQLHGAGVRRSSALADALLDPQFQEFGASGRVWDRISALEMMAEEEYTLPVADRFVATRLASDVVHLTYRVRRPERTTLRSSVWRRENGPWRVYFHQGTVQPPSSP